MRTERVSMWFAPSPDAFTMRLNRPLLVGVPVTGQRMVPTIPAKPGGGTGSEATGMVGEQAPTLAQPGRPVREHVTLLTDSVPELLHWKLPEYDVPTTPDNGTGPDDARRLTMAIAGEASPVVDSSRQMRPTRTRCRAAKIMGKLSTSIRNVYVTCFSLIVPVIFPKDPSNLQRVGWATCCPRVQFSGYEIKASGRR